jgi:hypothetical protein
MNPFVDPKKRGVLLPGGCKDLIDVLRLSKQKEETDCSTPTIRPEVRIGGLDQVNHYMAKLSAAAAQRSVLVIASLDGQTRVVLEGSTSGLTIFPMMGTSENENEAEEFFASRAIEPSVDFLVGQPERPTRVLGFQLSSDLSKAVELTTDLLRSVFRLDAEAEIEFTYLEMR